MPRILRSVLLYLITGRTFTETDAQEKKEIKKARRKAVKDYVNQKIQNATDRKKNSKRICTSLMV
jgi:predicted DNA-binding WGR domain protein